MRRFLDSFCGLWTWAAASEPTVEWLISHCPSLGEKQEKLSDTFTSYNFEEKKLTRPTWVVLRRQEVFNVFIRSQFFAVCQDPRFEKSRPFCQKICPTLPLQTSWWNLGQSTKEHTFLYLCNLKVYTLSDNSLNIKKLSFLPSQWCRGGTVEEHCWSWTSVWRYWKVALIFSLIADSSVECFKKDIASWHCSPSSCLFVLRTSLFLFGLSW